MSEYLPCLGILKLILAVYLILMIFDDFVNTNIYATVVKTYPIIKITAVTIPLRVGRKTNMKAAIQLINHKDTNAILTRLGVISS